MPSARGKTTVYRDPHGRDHTRNFRRLDVCTTRTLRYARIVIDRAKGETQWFETNVLPCFTGPCTAPGRVA